MFTNYLRLALRVCFFVFSFSLFSQSVYYTPPSHYLMGNPITPLVPTQTGGTILGATYRQVSLFAGTGFSGSTDTSDKLTSSFGAVRGMVKDAFGNYYVAENGSGKIRKINSNGSVTTVYNNSNFASIRDLAINTATGDIFFVTNNSLHALFNTNSENYATQEPVYTDGGIIAGTEAEGDAVGFSALFKSPYGVTMSADNSYLLIVDSFNHKIKKVLLSTFEVTTLCGSSAGSTNGTLSTATFNVPVDVAIVNENLIYVTDYSNNSIRKIDNGTVTTFAGGGSFDGISFDGTGSTAYIDHPHGITIDAMGNVYVAEEGNHKIRKITPNGVVTTLAGTLWNNSYSGTANGNGNNARFNHPQEIYYDAENGFLLVSDSENHQIKKIQIEGFSIIPEVVTGMHFDTSNGEFSGTPTAGSLKTQYVQTFEQTNLGSVNSTDVAINGNAVVRGGKLILTPMSNGQFGGVEIPATGENSNLLKVAFDVITVKSTDGADGLSYSFAPDAFATATATGAEMGTGTKLSISFADYSTNRGIRLYYDPSASSLGTTVDAHLLAYSNNTSWISKVAKVLISVSEDGKLTLTVDGAVIFDAVQLPADYLASDKSTWKHVFKSRTGGANDMHAIDNVAIQQGLGATTHTIVAQNHNVEQTLTTTINVAILPTVTTDAVSAIQSNQATVGYHVTAAGSGQLQEIGLVWDTTTTPTITDNKVVNNALTLGTFTTAITGLNHSTTYYVRAFATNEFGTTYGQAVSITTLINPPVISYNTPNIFALGTAINPLQPTNTGGAIGSATITTTFAGDGSIGASNGTGTAASFRFPSDVAMDAAGNLFVAEATNCLIRKITPEGIVTTFAGSGARASVDGTGTGASFNFPSSIVFDATGNLYVADRQGYKIRKITPDGVVTTLAGNDTQGSVDGTGTAASFNLIEGITIDKSTNDLYVCDYGNRKIRKITSAGVVTTFAGSGSYANTEGTGTEASFRWPTAITIDENKNLYVTSGELIFKITPSAVVTRYAGTPGTYGSDDGTTTSATFNFPEGIKIDAFGNLYVTEVGSHKIRKISLSGVVSTIAGTGLIGSNDGAIASFRIPKGLVFDASGNYLYVADYGNHKIRKIALGRGYTITPALPAGLELNGTTGIISGTPTLESPVTDYTVTAINNGGSSSYTFKIKVIYVPAPPVITYNPTNVFTTHTAIDPLHPTNTGGPLSGVAGTVSTLHQFSTAINSFVFDAAGNQYIVDDANHIILKRTTAGIVTTFAGTSGTHDYLDGTGTNAHFNMPSQITIDADGDLYVSDYNRIRKITAAGVVTTLAGSDDGYRNGQGTYAQFTFIGGMVVDPDKNLYVVDANNHAIRKITPDGVVSTFAGDGSAGSVDGNGTNAKFRFPQDITRDSDGNFFVTDTRNYKIRKITPNGEVTTFAGSQWGYQDGTGSSARFNEISRIAIDASNNLFVKDRNNEIRKITDAAVVTTLIGSTDGYQDGAIASAKFNRIRDLLFDSSGDLYITEFGGNVRKVIIPNDVYFISPSLPTGLVLDAATGIISGTPTLARPERDYTVTAINKGGTSSYTIKITVINVPAPTAEAQTLCNGATVADLVATGTDLQWYGASTGGTSLSASTVVASGTYYVSQTINSSESSRTSVTVTVKTSSVATQTASQCGTYTWAVNGQNYTQSGTYTAVLQNAIGCDSTITLNLTINELPTASVSTSSPTTVCQGTLVPLNANTGEGLTYVWKKNNTLISGASNATFSAINSGLFEVEVTNAAGCKTSSAKTKVTVNPIPAAGAISGGNYVCRGSSIKLTPTVAGGVWSVLKPNLANIDQNGNVTGLMKTAQFTTDIVAYTVTNVQGCSSTVKRGLGIDSLPVVPIIAGPDKFCSNGTVLYRCTNLGSVAWTAGPLLTASSAYKGVFTHRVAQNGAIPSDNFASSITATSYSVNKVCTSTSTKNIQLRTIASKAFAITAPSNLVVNAPVTVSASSITLTTLNTSNRSWSSGNLSDMSVTATSGLTTTIQALRVSTETPKLYFSATETSTGCGLTAYRQFTITAASSLVDANSNQTTSVNGVHLYPNPSNGRFTIENTDGATSVKLVDLAGRVIATQPIVTGNATVDFSGVATGKYMVHISGDNFNEVQPIVIE